MKKKFLYISSGIVALLWLANMGVKLCFDSWSDAGTFGDQFGAVNALFSGLAFIGLIYTIIQQTESIQQQTKSLNQQSKSIAQQQVSIDQQNSCIELQREDLQNQKAELELNRQEMERQTAEFEKQNAIMKKQAFEGTFFKMLEVHRQNAGNVFVDGKTTSESFGLLVDILGERYKAAVASLAEIETHPKDPDFKDGADILTGLTPLERDTFCIKYAYGHLTYGAGYHVNYDKESKYRKLEKSVEATFTNHITNYVKKGDLFKYNFFEGMLGHYYRTIFQIVMYVEQQDILSFSEKYLYVKMLRSQMSDYEQILFYYNALSNMGHPWINRTVESEDNDGGIIKTELPYSLIIKYRMIKNIPHFFDYFYADPRTFFKEEIKNWEKENEEPFFEQLVQMA